MSTTTRNTPAPRRARHFVDTAPFDPMHDEVLTP